MAQWSVLLAFTEDLSTIPKPTLGSLNFLYANSRRSDNLFWLLGAPVFMHKHTHAHTHAYTHVHTPLLGVMAALGLVSNSNFA